jgi:peptidylprolyl isomerase
VNQNLQILVVAGGATVAALGFVAGFLYYQSAPPAEDEIVEIGSEQGPRQVDASAYRELEGGVRIADFQEGTGPSPVPGQLIEVHYTGWLQADGKQFDSSIPRGEPIKFQFETGGVIRGWHVGLAGMKVGGKRQIVIPPALAYGPMGRPPVIPPDSTLVFEVELVGLGKVRTVPPAPTETFASATVGAEGIKIVDLQLGSGTVADERSVIETEMTVWLPSGQVFFSTYQGQDPVKFLLGGEGRDAAPLKGIDLASRGMMPGGKRLAELPPAVAFGEQGFRDQVPPNATIVIQLEAVSVSPPRTPPSAPPPYDASQLKTTESGLQYVDLEPGIGEFPKMHDLVVAEYTGWLADGKQFDSSFNSARPFTFALGRGMVIKAWDEGLATMRPGGKRLLIAPPDIAYGAAGKGDIPPDATLTFLVELVEVQRR